MFFIISNLFLISLLVTLVLKIFDLKYAQSTIEYEKKSYNFLSTSYDCVRGFKHDFSNIMQAIGGYILTEDLSGLKNTTLVFSKIVLSFTNFLFLIKMF